MEYKLPEELNLEYRFLDDEWKREYILARGHSEYANWMEAVQQVIQEIERLKFIFKQLGGSFGGEFVNLVPSDG